MARIPGFMLRHRIGVAPYLGVWAVYGARVDNVPCQIKEQLVRSQSQPGVVRVVTLTIVGQLDMPVVEGALLYLPDGRIGFASAVARHSAPGLPVPENTEVAVEVAGLALPPAGGEVVVLLRRFLNGEDKYHNARYRIEETEVPGVAVRAVSSAERTASGMGAGRDQTTDIVEVILPPGTVITSNDRMRIRGLVYEVDGTPEDLRDSATGAEPGIRAIGRRVKG